MRCRQSARLTPAAAIRISTSPAFGSGTGRVAGTSISGPPGALISMTVWVVGILASTAGPLVGRMLRDYIPWLPPVNAGQIGGGLRRSLLPMLVYYVTARCTCSGSAAAVPLQVARPECSQTVGTGGRRASKPPLSKQPPTQRSGGPRPASSTIRRPPNTSISLNILGYLGNF